MVQNHPLEKEQGVSVIELKLSSSEIPPRSHIHIHMTQSIILLQYLALAKLTVGKGVTPFCVILILYFL